MEGQEDALPRAPNGSLAELDGVEKMASKAILQIQNKVRQLSETRRAVNQICLSICTPNVQVHPLSDLVSVRLFKIDGLDNRGPDTPPEATPERSSSEV